MPPRQQQSSSVRFSGFTAAQTEAREGLAVTAHEKGHLASAPLASSVTHFKDVLVLGAAYTTESPATSTCS